MVKQVLNSPFHTLCSLEVLFLDRVKFVNMIAFSGNMLDVMGKLQHCPPMATIITYTKYLQSSTKYGKCNNKITKKFIRVSKRAAGI